MITYQYTQKDWTTFKEGIKREWAVTNGIGGYAGSSMIGAHSRTHQGYLIASLHAPIERYLVFSKINETATVGTRTLSFETSQHRASGKTVYTEGQKFLTSFIYDGSVHYTYETDNFSFEKHITLKRNANVCAVAYELTAGDNDCTFTLTPLFNYREHSESSTPDTLKFETFTEDRTFYLVPEKNKDIAILGTKAQILHNNHLIDNFFNAAFYNKKPKIFDIGIIDTLNTCVLCHPTVMFKKSLIYKHKLYYNENIKASEDQELWCKAILIVRICNLNEVLLQYRLHQNNASTVKKQGQNTAYQIKKKLLNKLLPYNSSILKNLAELETETLKIKECINQLGKHKTLDNQSKAPQKKFIFNFFSIIHTPDKSHKVITILGIKLKIKNLAKNNKDI